MPEARKRQPVPKKAKKKAPTKTRHERGRISVIETREVELQDLTVYHLNPRIGNIDKIAKSLHLNGLYRPIVVNLGSLTGRENEILAGNHTYLAARKPLFWQQDGETHDKPAWDTILCAFVDVDDEAAAQIVLADNKTADDGTYDQEAMQQLIEGLPELKVAATGFDSKEWDELLESFKPEDVLGDTSELDALDSLEDHIEDMEDKNDKATVKPPKFDETALGDEGESDEQPSVTSRAATKDMGDEEEEGVEILDADDEIRGAFNLKSSAYFDGVGYWNIPKLRTDMLMQPEEVPDTLTAWAGSATKYGAADDTWWLYNFGVDSTSGMKDVSKVIVSFYTYDEYFEPWWFSPDKYVAKMLNSGIKYAVTPDFSDDLDHGRAFSIWQLFRNRWLGRYMQEAGLKIIPNISWPDGDLDYLKKVTLPTLPKNIPVISMQVQTLQPKKLEQEHLDSIKAEFQAVMDHIQPKMLLIYAGQPGYDFFMENVDIGKTKVRFILNRQAKLSISRKGRKRKDTL